MDRQCDYRITFPGVRSALYRTIGVILIAVVLAGCAQVQPKADYERARQLVTETTGADAVYDPEAPLLTDKEMDAFLTDGLTLEEAVRMALLNNRRLQAEFLSIGVAKADWVQAGLFANPAVGFSVQFPEGGGVSNVQASIAQNIVDLWQIPKRKQVAQADLDATVLRIALCGDHAGRSDQGSLLPGGCRRRVSAAGPGEPWGHDEVARRDQDQTAGRRGQPSGRESRTRAGSIRRNRGAQCPAGGRQRQAATGRPDGYRTDDRQYHTHRSPVARDRTA